MIRWTGEFDFTPSQHGEWVRVKDLCEAIREQPTDVVRNGWGNDVTVIGLDDLLVALGVEEREKP